MNRVDDQRLNMYSQKGCVGCCVCEKGAKNVGRTLSLWTLAVFTAGFGLLALLFYKKCVYCAHNTLLNSHIHGGL